MIEQPPRLLSDEEYVEVDSLGNATWKELAFLMQHAEDDQLDDANNVLTAILLNLGRIAEIIGANNVTLPESTALRALASAVQVYRAEYGNGTPQVNCDEKLARAVFAALNEQRPD